MGNCLVLQEKVMKTDGETIEHKSPIKVDKLLSKFSHATRDHEHPHEVNNTHPMVQNHLHFPIKTKKKTVQFSDEVLEGGDEASRVVRIKLVIRKKELQQMLSEGEISVDGLILKVQNQEITNKAESNDRDGVIAKGWFPALESIPEIN